MKRFARLYQELDETTKTNRKVRVLVRYFGDVAAEDAAWAVWFLCGNRPRRAAAAGKLREWCAEVAGIPGWLLAEAYDFVGDLAETIALLLPAPQCSCSGTLTEWIQHRLWPLISMKEGERKIAVIAAWSELDQQERFVFNKLLTGGFRVGVSQQLVGKALSEYSGVAADVIAHRLMGDWTPTARFFSSLLSHDTESSELSRPYPFCLANPFAVERAEAGSLFNTPFNKQLITDSSANIEERLGAITDWAIEWKWDGLRAQVIRRQGQTFIWSRGEELLTERFPEVLREADQLPDGTVLDGELVGWKAGQPLPFGDLQKRITRKSVGRKLLADVPVRFLAFDLLEITGQDVRGMPLRERRTRLEVLLANAVHQKHSAPTTTCGTAVVGDCAAPTRPQWPEDRTLSCSPQVVAASWAEALALRQGSRERQVEGLMLKRVHSEYGVGRVAGLWWKWKIEPHRCDAVLIYAQRGHGRRAGKFSDYTFAAWHNGQLVPFAKAYSGLTDEEIQEVDQFIRGNTLERFGPVQSVKAELVFELAFEGLQLSSRHKAGIAVRFPRIVRWRRDKTIEHADSLETIRSLVRQEPGGSTSTPVNLSQPRISLTDPGGLFAGADAD